MDKTHSSKFIVVIICYTFTGHIRKIIRDEVLNQQEKELVKNGIDEKNDRNSYNSVPSKSN